MIEFDGVSKVYKGVRALDDVTFTVERGGITGLLGPNGAGKSTAMRILCGLSRADSGSATVLGKPYAALSNPAFSVGSLLDAGAVHPGRTGRETLILSAMTLGLPKSRVEEILDVVGLSKRESRQVLRGYSLGMKQRLGIGQALLGHPRALILDEPANGLDPHGIQWMRSLLRGLADDGCSILLSSHLLHEVEQIADSLVVIGHGRVLAQGTVDEISDGRSLEQTYLELTSHVDRSTA